jgi:hypothetical protein
MSTPHVVSVAEYAEAMQAGAVFPPLVVFEEDGRFWLAEGFHRLEAYTAAGFAEVPCVVHQGGLRDAILLSVGANFDHGVRRTNADKHRAVLMLLRDPEWQSWSDNAIAKACAVSQPLVTRLRAAHLQLFEDAPRTVSRGGKVYSMDTARIGRKAEPEPVPAEDEAQSDLIDGSSEAAEASAAEEVAAAANVIHLGPRLKIVPSAESVER